MQQCKCKDVTINGRHTHVVLPHQHCLFQGVLQCQSSSPSLLVSSSVSSSLSSIFLPLFDYCDVVWSGCTKSKASRLETLLNYACCTVRRKRRESSTSAACRELGLSTLASRRKLHLALTMFNCMSSKSPSYLSQLFSLPSSHYNTHSASSSQLNLPQNWSSFGQKSFSFMGAALSRSLPWNIQDTRDFNSYTHFARDISIHFCTNIIYNIMISIHDIWLL